MHRDKRTNLPDYSVMMSVYKLEEPRFLRECLESMFSQTYPTDDFVLVCDGELTQELNSVIAEYESRYPDSLHPVRLNESLGIGGCANAGIRACKNELIVKMDSDDIALPQRCEKQISFMAKNPQLDMCGAFIEEFDSQTGKSIAVKKTPLKNKEIHSYAKRRNPFNNQTLVFKRSFALGAGGYETLKRCEDYDFVVRMLQKGAKGANIPEVLVRYRVTAGNYNRRRNWANTKAFISVRWRIHRSGYSSFLDFLIPSLTQLGFFILPQGFTVWFYKRFLR